MVYRCRHQIVADILSALSRAPGEGLGITRISLSVGAPVDRVRRVMRELEASGLVYLDRDRRVYVITEKGYEWLSVYLVLESIFKPPPTTV